MNPHPEGQKTRKKRGETDGDSLNKCDVILWVVIVLIITVNGKYKSIQFNSSQATCV